MNNDYKALFKEHKVGIILAVITVLAFAVGFLSENRAVAGPALMVGLCCFVTLVHSLTTARSVDPDPGEHQTGEGSEAPPPPPRVIDFDASEASEDDAAPPDDAKKPEADEDDEEWQDFAPYHRAGPGKPLNGYRKAGIVVGLSCLGSMILAGALTGTAQVVFLVLGVVCFMGIFVLMGRDLDQQRKEWHERRKKKNGKDDPDNK